LFLSQRWRALPTLPAILDVRPDETARERALVHQHLAKTRTPTRIDA